MKPFQESRREKAIVQALVWWAAAGGLAGLLGLMFWRTVDRQRSALYSNECAHRLVVMHRLLSSYHDKYGCFPPAYTTDEHGRPMHSWRILVLEGIDEPESVSVYNAYNFKEPWDGPNNRKLAGRMPSFYACPSEHRTARPVARTLANYVVLVGPQTAFPAGRSTSRDDILDDPDQTLFVVETTPGVPWLKPVDLDVSRMSFVLNDPSRPSISSKDYGGPNVVFVNSRVESTHNSISPKAIRAMMTVAGGEVIGGPPWARGIPLRDEPGSD